MHITRETFLTSLGTSDDARNLSVLLHNVTSSLITHMKKYNIYYIGMNFRNTIDIKDYTLVIGDLYKNRG